MIEEWCSRASAKLSPAEIDARSPLEKPANALLVSSPSVWSAASSVNPAPISSASWRKKMETSRDRGGFPPRRWLRVRIPLPRPRHQSSGVPDTRCAAPPPHRRRVDLADDDFSCVRDGSITKLWHWTAQAAVTSTTASKPPAPLDHVVRMFLNIPVRHRCVPIDDDDGSGRPGERQKSDLSRGKPVSV